MKDNNLTHKLLQKQLHRVHSSVDILPGDINSWRLLLEKINNCYQEFDQDKYILERSSSLAYQEVMTLNKRLEKVQSISKIGYWDFDQSTNAIIFSKEFYNILEIHQEEVNITYQKMLDMAHPDDKRRMNDCIYNTLNDAIEREGEFRLITEKKNSKWCHIIFNATLDKVNAIHKLTGVIMDITKRKESEENIALLNRQIDVALKLNKEK